MPTAPVTDNQLRKRTQPQAKAIELRPNAQARGYGSRWQKARKFYLAKHSLCVECEDSGRVVAATVVDHIDPHRGDKVKFWDSSNWQSLCKRCHDRKTGRGE